MKDVEGLYYTNEHEWIKVDGDNAYVGITDFAQNALGDIVFVELPEVDDEIDMGDTLGVVESVKAASDIYSPLTGKVLEVNEELEDTPENLNSDPYNNWIVYMEIRDEKELEDVMDAEGYKKFCEEV